MIINVEQNTHDWLEYRKTKFNASECGTIMGVGFVKPYKLAEIKYQNGVSYQNRAMQQGHEYEPRIREWIEAQQGATFTPCVMQSDKDERFSASLDGFNADLNSILEIKFSANEYEHIEKHDKPSDKYYWQVQHQYFVSGAKRCIFAVGRLNDSFELEVITCEVKRSEKDIFALRAKWDEFYKTYGRLQDDSHHDDEPLIDKDFQALADEITMKQTALKIMQAELNELKERAIAKANGRELKVGTITIYKTERKQSYDYKAYCDDHCIIWNDKYIKPATTSWGVRVTV